MAVVVGDAAVRVRPETGDFEKDAEGGIVGAMGRLGGKGAVAMGAAIGGTLALGAGFSEALERGALSDKLAASLGLTEAKSAEVGKVAGSLFADAYGDSMETVNAAVGAVMTSIDGMATSSSADLEAMTARALNFATAFDLDVNRATQIAGQLMRTGLAKDGVEAFDLLTAASQKVPAAVREDVLDAADEYGTFFASLGFSGEQAFGTLVKGAEQGMYGIDKAGDAVKEFTIRATDMSAASTSAYDSIGLDAQEMANKILAGGDTAQGATQRIIDGLLGIKDPATQANTAIALFGTPLEDIGTDKVPAFLASLSEASGGLDDVAGASDRMGDTLNDNASANLTSLMRSAQSLAVDFLGGQLIPKVQEITGWMTDHFGPAVTEVKDVIEDDVIPAVKDLATFIGDNETPITVIAGLIASLFIPHLIALALQSTWTGITTAASWVATQAAAVWAAIVHSAQIAWMILRWIALAAAAVFNAGLTVGAWIGMGIAAAANAVAIAAVWLAQTAMATGRVVVGWVVAAASTLAAWVSMAVSASVNALIIGATWLAQTATTTASIIAGWALAVAGVVAGWVVMATQSLLNAARMAAAWLIALGPVGWIIAIIVGLVALIIANWETVKEWTVKAFKAIVDAVVGAWNWIVDAISTGITTVVNFVTGLPGKIVSALGAFGSLLFSKGKELMQGLVDGIASAASFVGNVAKNVVNAVIGFVNDHIIDGINDLLEFKIMGITVNPPDIPHIPRLHSGGVFDSGQGEGLALLRDQERVITPEQRVIADRLLGDLLGGSLAAADATSSAAGGVNVTNNVTQLPGESGASLAARVTQDTVWRLSSGITRRVGAGVGALV